MPRGRSAVWPPARSQRRRSGLGRGVVAHGSRPRCAAAPTAAGRRPCRRRRARGRARARSPDRRDRAGRQSVRSARSARASRIRTTISQSVTTWRVARLRAQVDPCDADRARKPFGHARPRRIRRELRPAGARLTGRASRRRTSRSGSARRPRAGRAARLLHARRTPSPARAASSAAGGSSSAARPRGGTRSPAGRRASVRPASGAPRASVSSTRTVVVPTARTRSARADPLPRLRRDRVRSPCSRCSARSSTATGRNVSSPTCSVTRSTSSRASSSGVKCRPAVGAAAEPASPRVDRLVPLGIGERLGDVRRQRRLARRLALEANAPAPLAEVLEQLDGAVAAGPACSRRVGRASASQTRRRRSARAAGPRPSAARSGSAPGRRACRSRRRASPAELAGKVGESAVSDRAGRALVDEQPRLVPPRGRMLGDQLRRKLVLELG